MYGLVFYYFYRWALYRYDPNPRSTGVNGVILAVAFQGVMIYTVIQHLSGELLIKGSFSESYFERKWLNGLCALPLIIGVAMIFNKARTNRVIEKYDNKQNPFSFKYWLLFILFWPAPLVVTFFILR